MRLDKQKVNLQLAKKCLSNLEAAELAEISANRFLQIVKGRSVTPKTAGKIARALGCDITDILADDQAGEEV